MKSLLNGACVLSLLISAANAEAPADTAAKQEQGTVLAIECEDLDFVVEIGDQQAWLFLSLIHI